MLKRTFFTLVFIALMSVWAVGQARQFLQATQYSTGANSDPQAFAVADFNGDGFPDVAVADSGANAVSIFLGKGDGTFVPVKCGSTATCPVGLSPQGIAAADFNQDGNMDLAVTNNTSGTVTILFGNGQGGFAVQSTSPVTGKNPRGIVAGDFNGDGLPDIVVANSGDGDVGLFLNNGHGGFGAQTTYTTGFNPWSIAVGDLNNDGYPDIVIANNNNNNTISIYLGVKGGGFSTQLQASTGAQNLGSPVGVAIGDFNGDGNPDVAVAVQGDGSGQDLLSILIGNGKGGFGTPATYPTAPFPVAVTTADLNGDGNLDVAVAAANGNVVTVFWGNGTGAFSGQVNCGTGDIPSAVVTADLNKDGKSDLLVANSQGNSFSVIVNNGNDTFQSRLDYVAGTNAHSVVAGDFNGDGILDLAFADSSASEISVTLGNGDGTFQAPAYFSTGTATNPVFIVEGDFNKDGIPDVAVANYATSTVSVFLGAGNGTFQPHVDYPVGNPNLVNPVAEPTSIAIGDFNGDGYPDLAVTNFNENSVSILLNEGKTGPGLFTPAPNCSPSQNACPVGNGPLNVAVGNFNGGPNLDLVVVNETDNNASILVGNGDGTFTAEPTTTAVGGNPKAVAVADLNGDGILDLAVADFQTTQVSVLLGNGSNGVGNGTFQAAEVYPTGAYAAGVVIGDFNGDGIPDLALTTLPSQGNPGNQVSLLLGNATPQGKPAGTFAAPALFGAGYLSYSLVAGDFNGDGALDLAVANGGSNTVSILLNLQGTAMTFTSSAQQISYGQSVTLTATVGASVSNGVGPTGTVTFMSGSTQVGTPQSLTGAPISVITSTLPAGVDSLSAVYSGDSNYQPHTLNLSETVSPLTSVTSSPNPSVPNQSVTFTATVTSPPVQPTGTVTFFNGSTAIGSGSVNASGQATFSTSALPMGTSDITAQYSGNSKLMGSTSTVLKQQVGQETPLVVVTSNPSSANLSQSVTLTATVSGPVGTPTGTVTFFSGTVQLASSSLNASGVATYSTTSLAAGTDSVTASYTGDNNFLSGTSLPVLIVVTAPSFSLTANSLSPGSVSPGSTATTKVTISTLGGLDPSTVKLTCSVSPSSTPAATCSLGSIAVVNGGLGTATLTFASAGPTSVLAVPSDGRGPSMLFAVGIMLPAMLLGGVGMSKPGRKKLMNFCLLLALTGCMAHMACGGGNGSGSTGPSGNSGTPAGTYQVMVSGSASGMQNSIPTPLSVTVQ